MIRASAARSRPESRIESDIEQYSAAIVEIRELRAHARGLRAIRRRPVGPVGAGLRIADLRQFVGALLGAGLVIVLGLRANRVGGRDELGEYIDAPVMV